MFTKEQLINKIKSIILWGIYGDAFGLPFELWTPDFIQKKINEMILEESNYININGKLCLPFYRDYGARS